MCLCVSQTLPTENLLLFVVGMINNDFVKTQIVLATKKLPYQRILPHCEERSISKIFCVINLHIID